MSQPRAALLAGLLLATAATPAAAAEFFVNGVLFSDRYGGFNLLSVNGMGTRDDPFLIVEEVGGAGNAVLSIEGWKAGYHTSEYGGTSMVIRKVVINATEKTWNSYELELREELSEPSGYLDGLSFGQPLRESRPAASDRMPNALFRDEPYDAVVFSGGDVAPGEKVAFDFILTDMTPVDQVFLIQRLKLDISGLPGAPAAGPGAAAGAAPATAPSTAPSTAPGR